MRGSVYFQTSVLAKIVFRSGAKKIQRKDKSSDKYNLLASYESMDSYRKIWNDLGFYIYETNGIKNFEKIESKHIELFMHEKITQGVSHCYLQKISSAIGKLEFALTLFAKEHIRNATYDFSKRIQIVKQAKKQKLTANNYRDRAYENPQEIISYLSDAKFKIAANIQLFGGARSEGVCLIKKEQLLGIKKDPITNQTVGEIITKEKGGKVGNVHISIDIYNALNSIITQDETFQIDYRRYIDAILNASRITNIKSEGSHGFRWNFAQRRVVEYHNAGFSYHESLQMVSYEMKHQRPDITCHYIG